LCIANCRYYRTGYNIYVYIDIMHRNFICGLSDVIIKTFSQSVSKYGSARLHAFSYSSHRCLLNSFLFGVFLSAVVGPVRLLYVACYCFFWTKKWWRWW